MIYNDKERADLLAEVEQQRREKPTLNAWPLNGHPELRDYAGSGAMISAAIHHLDEGIPTGQKRRVELALDLLVTGAHDLTAWLRAKGYDTRVADYWLRQETKCVPLPDRVSVLAKDALNYCYIVSLLGMEEEGDVVGAVRAAHATLTGLGYSYTDGAEQWKPPVNEAAEPDTDVITLRLPQYVASRLEGRDLAQILVSGLKDIELANAASHDLYTNQDKDRPDAICDANGQVVLSLCKHCGAGEAELLDRPCPGAAEEGEPTRGYIAQAEEPEGVREFFHASQVEPTKPRKRWGLSFEEVAQRWAALASRLKGLPWPTFPPSDTIIPDTDPDKCYVLGFVFNPSRSHVALIRKRRGMDHLVGRWNGLGGRVKAWESIEQAMSREAYEEAGLVIAPGQWRVVGPLQFAAKRGGFLLTAERSDELLCEDLVSSDEGEARIWSVESVMTDASEEPFMANLKWMVALCLDPERPKFLGVDYTPARPVAA